MGKQWAKGNYCDVIPDTLFGVCLKDCCYKHDVYYWKHNVTRKEADLMLRECVFSKFTKKNKRFLGLIVGKTIYFFIRLLGWIKW